MTEILFMGRRIDNEEWVAGYVTRKRHSDHKGKVKSYYFNALNELGEVVECAVSAESISQFTGLIDKNGKKIFEGDIVCVPMRGCCDKTTNEIGVVEWLNGAFSVAWKKKENGRHFAGYLENIEVIGNIYDNPKLVENNA